MAEAANSPAKLYEVGRDNYERLVSYCRRLEQGGFWNQAGKVMKQSGAEVLDLYVQSVLLSLVDSCGEIVQVQREYIQNITNTNPLEISAKDDVDSETIRYGKRTTQMPPILLQLCGVYDREKNTHMAAEFLDTFLNILLCMADIQGRGEEAQSFLKRFYYQVVMFIQSSPRKPAEDESYIVHKLQTVGVHNAVRWLIQEDRPSETPKADKNQKSRHRGQKNKKAAAQAEEGKSVHRAAETQQKSASVKKAEAQDGEALKEGKLSEAEEKRLKEEENQNQERLRLEAEQERLAAEQERIREERLRLEEEQRIAKEEFQKVKKRLKERERTEREAQEKRIAALLEELNELVGLKSVKEEIRSLVNLIKVRKMREKMNMPAMDMSYHMVFTGNPGTGKTTVARLVAKIYRELGILSGGQLVETDRSRLVAGYVGQTAINVREIVEQAIGGVLFIDEAYALVSPDTSNDFGAEAVDTLVKLMEDHRDNLVVIVAGYTEEMKVFLKSNTGLISRFNKFIAFDDYTQKQLLEILEVMVKRTGLTVDKDAVSEIGDRLAEMTMEEKKDFGNARGVRNIFEKMVVNQANRLVELENPTREELMTLTRADALLVTL